MPRQAAEYTRVTEVASFVNADWKTYWYRAIENGSKTSGTVGLIELIAQECIAFAAKPRSASEWKEFLGKRTALKEADRISRESTEFGKAVHLIAENFLLGLPEPKVIDLSTKTHKNIRAITDRERFSGGLLIKWCQEAKVKPIMLGGKPAIETELRSEKWKLTGHPDLVCTFGDDPTVWLVDWKTSKDFRDEYKLQLAAYAEIINEMYGIRIENGVIIRVPSDPNVAPQFQDHPVHNLFKYFEAFVSCLDSMNFFKNRGRWREGKEAA